MSFKDKFLAWVKILDIISLLKVSSIVIKILSGSNKKLNAGIIKVIPKTSKIVAKRIKRIILYKSKVFYFPIIKWILLINFIYFII